MTKIVVKSKCLINSIGYEYKLSEIVLKVGLITIIHTFKFLILDVILEPIFLWFKHYFKQKLNKLIIYYFVKNKMYKYSKVSYNYYVN
jgi:hypothetical protein